jgi:hypothetical protein
MLVDPPGEVKQRLDVFTSGPQWWPTVAAGRWTNRPSAVPPVRGPAPSPVANIAATELALVDAHRQRSHRD